ncbi:MAG TPA: pilin [Marinobacter antarcticus]|uniref:Pilin n=1 Tax=Marinobacter antarcticus TaxID=564117 RepID=A0A831VZV8_9GAMM|nr:pilin [Marinobacter antarcticus]
MNHAQKGFTLIELMIVVAIIGILAAIAIPQYQDYIARSQITRAVSEVSALKTAIEEELLRGNNPSAIDDASASYTSAADELGYTSSDLFAAAPTINIDGTGGKTLEATLDNNVSSGIKGTKVILTRTAEGAYTCKVDGGSAAAFKKSFAPSGCPAS